MTTKHIVLIDGNSLAYRAFYALPDTMRTTTGITTNAIYGFTTMLIKVLDSQPDFVAIAFDRPEPTFRHTEYKEYKATRQKAPPTLHEQMPYVKEVAAAFGIPIYELAGYEGDDIIGTLAVEAGKKGYDVTILTGDLDPLQLVNDQIKVLATRKGITDTVLYGPKEVEARYDGLKPEQLIDYKALKGDSSDNIPGVPKVGEKTAVELLKEYKTLDLFKFCKLVKIPVILGNCVTYETTLDLMKTGAAGLLIGIGPGAACTTRGVLGIGVPQVTATVDAASARDFYFKKTGRYVAIITDGGMNRGGDICKAFACGADSVMIGSSFARAKEAPGRGYHWGM
ncbi:MAG: IMP dehydrogenase, partial [Candidatus Margulisbacteria bacterium]|nr:IMP dehydrogenase [Candidatus Margulisiibacteriota bacterium]